MPRNWGRLVSATVSESECLARCSERAALVYLLTLPRHDGEGRLEVDDVSMVDMVGRFGIVHRWNVDIMPAIREEISSAGLWRVYETEDGKLCAEVIKWERHQRLDRITRGSDLTCEAPPQRGEQGGMSPPERGDVSPPISPRKGA